ncbi:hypothetical protein M758_1G302500 [Ceratodon purpureus]|uniref:Secreted protein n=1 Tax=Ceratodon purpureus TaxID=3225 RepID=A0A8T0JER3_CERPU|nr:hypothetical protein KC19_1G308700 [Ceratodon purpureus]KAG0632083.1 hypothetical protein M758_1G302500 [Ceratodon purpureus]
MSYALSMGAKILCLWGAKFQLALDCCARGGALPPGSMLRSDPVYRISIIMWQNLRDCSGHMTEYHQIPQKSRVLFGANVTVAAQPAASTTCITIEDIVRESSFH